MYGQMISYLLLYRSFGLWRSLKNKLLGNPPAGWIDSARQVSYSIKGGVVCGIGAKYAVTFLNYGPCLS